MGLGSTKIETTWHSLPYEIRLLVRDRLDYLGLTALACVSLHDSDDDRSYRRVYFSRYAHPSEVVYWLNGDFDAWTFSNQFHMDLWAAFYGCVSRVKRVLGQNRFGSCTMQLQMLYLAVVGNHPDIVSLFLLCTEFKTHPTVSMFMARIVQRAICLGHAVCFNLLLNFRFHPLAVISFDVLVKRVDMFQMLVDSIARERFLLGLIQREIARCSATPELTHCLDYLSQRLRDEMTDR